MLNVCDSCGTHALELLACARCRITFYCNGACQRRAWRAHHSRQCAALRDEAAAVLRADADVPAIVAEPEPYMRAHAFVRSVLAEPDAPAGDGALYLEYAIYVHAMEAFLAPGPLRREHDARTQTLPAVRRVLDDVLPAGAGERVGALCLADAYVRAIFSRLTLRLLPTHSSMAFRDVRASVDDDADDDDEARPSRAFSWRRGGGDNARTHVARVVAGVPRTASPNATDTYSGRQVHFVTRALMPLLSVTFLSRGTCAATMRLLTLVNGRTCALHGDDAERAFARADVAGVDVCVAASGLDVCTAARVLARLERTRLTCACRHVLPAVGARASTLLGPQAPLLDVGLVRVTFANATYVDVVALGRRTLEHQFCGSSSTLVATTPSGSVLEASLDVYGIPQASTSHPHWQPMPLPAKLATATPVPLERLRC